MADESPKKPDWAIVFLSRLCVIGWVCAIFYETLLYDPMEFFKPFRQMFLLFGVWACAIALIHAVALVLIRRQGIFVFFLLITIPPSIHFGYIVRNIAIENKWTLTGKNVGQEVREKPHEGVTSKPDE